MSKGPFRLHAHILLLLLLLLHCDYITVKENRLIITKYHMRGNFCGTKLSRFSRNAQSSANYYYGTCEYIA